MGLFSDKQLAVLGVGLGVGIYFFATRTGVGKAASTAVEATGDLFSSEPDNVWYSGANKWGEQITGERDFNLGSKVYEIIHGE